MAIDSLAQHAEAIQQTDVPRAFQFEPERWQELQRRIKELTSEPEYLKYLRAQRALWKYTFSNTMLILVQKPDAQLVQSMTTWNALGRHVRKGEHALRIMVPFGVGRKASGDEPSVDGATEIDPVHGGQPAGVAISAEKSILPVTRQPVDRPKGFRLAGCVFDISQTEGDPLPEWTASPLDGMAPEGLFEALKGAAEKRGANVAFADFGADTKNGDYSLDTRTIRIKAGMSPAMTAKTMCHELAHHCLHSREASETVTRPTAEIEAESVAYLVCGESGLDTSSYSWHYLANWGAAAAGGANTTLSASATRIQGIARDLVDEVQPREGFSFQMKERALAYRKEKYGEFDGPARKPRRFQRRSTFTR
ncbi:MAG: ImmA/IrrE family metallo-endopeptidase [Candidatus Dormibacteria bacterium]